MLKKVLLILLVVISIFYPSAVLADTTELLKNPGIEDASSDDIKGWVKWAYKTDSSKYIVDTKVFKSGSNSIKIVSEVPNDTRLKQEIKVNKGKYYKLSAWVKTENVGKDGKGANLSVEGITDTSESINGTSQDWKKLEMFVDPDSNIESFNITIGIGGYGSENTGTAWFDDISVEELPALPAGVNAAKIGQPQSDQSSDSNASGSSEPLGLGGKYNIWMTIFTGLYLFISIAVYFIIRNKQTITDKKTERIVLWAMLAAGLIFRLIVAPLIEGWPNDISANKAWALAAAKENFNFYTSGIWCDYPPFFIYVFMIVGKLTSIFGTGTAFTVLIKLPSIFADLATAYLLYRIAKKHFNQAFALLAAGLYAFSPLVLLDSTIWGQVDSFFTMIIIGALILLVERKVYPATVLFAVAVMMKPQAIFFFPVLLFDLIKRKNVKTFITSFLIGVGTCALIVIPFSFTQNTVTDKFTWVFDLYFNTASQYPFATMNAFNFFGMIGSNYADVSSKLLGISYTAWGFLFDALLVVFAGYVYFKGKHIATPILTALILNVGAFVFSVKMHERYMFPAVAIALLVFIYYKDKRLLGIFAGLSAVIFLNVHLLFFRVLSLGIERFHIPAKYPLMLVGSLAAVALFAYIAKVAVDLSVRNIWVFDNEKSSGETSNSTSVPKSTLQAPKYTKLKLDKKDFIIMSCMTAVYLVIALVNLGSLSVPKTPWQPANTGDSFVIDLGKETQLSRIYYYGGITDRSYDNSKYTFEAVDGSGKTTPITVLERKDIYKWSYVNVDAKASKIKVTADTPKGTLLELGIFENGSTSPVKISNITDKKLSSGGTGTPENLFDEQDLVEYAPSFMKGMHFDEIYHARTAYEFVNLIEPYEWTHPPLGKVIIAFGTLIFGMNPFGWRIMGTLFGVLMVPIMYLFGRKVFNKHIYAFFTAFLMMFDFMHFTQTRIATIDVYGTFFVILMYYFMYDYFINKSYVIGYKESLKLLFITGLFFGLGTASKWIGLYAGGGLALLLFLTKIYEFLDYRRMNKAKKDPQLPSYSKFVNYHVIATLALCVVFFVVIPVIIYILSYIPYMSVPGPGHGLSVVWKNQTDMFNYHSRDVLNSTHPFSSSWWQWPIISKPIWFYSGSDLPVDRVSTIVSMGNPAIWWAGILAVFGVIALAFRKVVNQAHKLAYIFAAIASSVMIIVGNTGGIRFLTNLGVFVIAGSIITLALRYDKKIGLIMIAFAFQYLPWVPIERITFIYHFFSSVPFVILSIVYLLKLLYEKHRWAKYIIFGYLGIVLFLFIAFYPAISGFEESKTYIDSLKWFSSWIF
ncbi:MAG: glycosyltransferase family 39 protein [Clostridia bacterium]|nr:glycosyltransferase family 39 protein [Clostridia bacterium]